MIEKLQEALRAKRDRADGSMLKLIKHTLTVGVKDREQVVTTTIGVPQGSPISPLYSNIYLNLLKHLWHSRGYPEKLGATLHRFADDAIVVCRRSPQPALAACRAGGCIESGV